MTLGPWLPVCVIRTTCMRACKSVWERARACVSVCLLAPPSLIREPPGVWSKKAHTLPINLVALGGPVQDACMAISVRFVQYWLVRQRTVLMPLTEQIMLIQWETKWSIQKKPWIPLYWIVHRNPFSPTLPFSLLLSHLPFLCSLSLFSGPWPL